MKMAVDVGSKEMAIGGLNNPSRPLPRGVITDGPITNKGIRLLAATHCLRSLPVVLPRTLLRLGDRQPRLGQDSFSGAHYGSVIDHQYRYVHHATPVVFGGRVTPAFRSKHKHTGGVHTRL